jgi:hypothetical protein
MTDESIWDRELYIDLAGVEFPEETAKLGARLWGSPSPTGQLEHD